MRNDTDWSIVASGGKVFACKIQNFDDPSADGSLDCWQCIEIVDVRQVGPDGLLRQSTQFLLPCGLNELPYLTLDPQWVMDLRDLSALERDRLQNQFNDFENQVASKLRASRSKIVLPDAH